MSHRLFSSLVLVVLFVVTLVGCGEAGTDDLDERITEQVADATGLEPADSDEPCELLSDELLRSHFDLGGAEVTRRPSEYSPHPLCMATWPRPDAEEIEARRAEEMSEYLRRKMQGEDVERPDFRTSNEVSLTINNQIFADAESARSSFESSMRMLSEGISSETDDGEEITFQADTEPVDGVGLDARWVPEQQQLSVVTSSRIFHVGVLTGADAEEDRKKALAVAAALSDRL